MEEEEDKMTVLKVKKTMQEEEGRKGGKEGGRKGGKKGGTGKEKKQEEQTKN